MICSDARAGCCQSVLRVYNKTCIGKKNPRTHDLKKKKKEESTIQLVLVFPVRQQRKKKKAKENGDRVGISTLTEPT